MTAYYTFLGEHDDHDEDDGGLVCVEAVVVMFDGGCNDDPFLACPLRKVYNVSHKYAHNVHMDDCTKFCCWWIFSFWEINVGKCVLKKQKV